MSTPSLGGPSRSPSNLQAVSLLKLWGTTVYNVRLLSYSPLGLFTHWIPGKPKGHSELCTCDTGHCEFAKFDRLWKSYQPVEVLNPTGTLWQAHVLEVSEHLELDMRTIAVRGQVWHIGRRAGRAGKQAPIDGFLYQVRDASKLREPFDVTLVMRTVYHTDVFVQTVPNPLPPRLMLEPVEEEQRVVEHAKPDESPQAAGAAEMWKQAKELAAKNGKPATVGPRFY